MEHAFEVHLGKAQAIVLARNLGALLLMENPAEDHSLKHGA
jgi:hypothetical protein